MKARRPSLKQPTPQELTDACLLFLRTKFYQGNDRAFFQDRNKLLTWVVLFPASWLNKRGVTIHGDQYRQIFFKVFMQAAAHMETKVKYVPAYLRQVIQSHLAIHGEEYYEEAKSVRNLAEATLLLIGRPVASAQAAPDPVRELALARQLILGSKKKSKTVLKGDVKLAVNLELKLS